MLPWAEYPTDLRGSVLDVPAGRDRPAARTPTTNARLNALFCVPHWGSAGVRTGHSPVIHS